MDEQQRKAMLKETCDIVSRGYDGDALRFFVAILERGLEHEVAARFTRGTVRRHFRAE